VPATLAGPARAAADVARHPRQALERSAALADVLLRDEVVPAPKTSINIPIGTRRRFDVVRADLDELKAVKRELGGSVNDVVLAATAGGLRRLLLSRDEKLPSRGLRAMVPVNVRAASEQLELGNKITSLFVHLPVAEPEPLRRYRLTMGEAEDLKHGSQAIGGATLISLAGAAPPMLHSFLARSLFASRLFNVTITNVPGPQQPLYAHGCRMEEILPLVPLAADHAVGVAVISYAGKVFFGLNGDDRAAADLHVLRGGIEDSLAELRTLAGATTA
jgi:diacylglycerol O-acyltransferase